MDTEKALEITRIREAIAQCVRKTIAGCIADHVGVALCDGKVSYQQWAGVETEWLAEHLVWQAPRIDLCERVADLTDEAHTEEEAVVLYAEEQCPEWSDYYINETEEWGNRSIYSRREIDADDWPESWSWEEQPKEPEDDDAQDGECDDSEWANWQSASEAAYDDFTQLDDYIKREYANDRPSPSEYVAWLERFSADIAALPGCPNAHQFLQRYVAEESLRCWDDILVVPRAWWCADSEGWSDSIIEADTAGEAADEFSTAGAWVDDIESTYWDRVTVAPVALDIWGEVVPARECDPHECYTVVTHPREPACPHERGHRWVDAGVRGHGGGVIVSYRCPRCGLLRHEDSYAQDPETGEQGLDSISYEMPDDDDEECDDDAQV